MLIRLKSNQTPKKLRKDFYNYLKKLSKKHNPVFAKCRYKNNIQIWTDGYVASFIKHGYLDIESEETTTFASSMDNIRAENKKLCDRTIPINIETILAYFKVSKSVFIHLDVGGYIGFRKEVFKNFITLLDLQNLDKVIDLKYCSDNHTKIYYKDDNGNEYIMMALKVESETSNFSDHHFTISEDRAYAIQPTINLKECF